MRSKRCPTLAPVSQVNALTATKNTNKQVHPDRVATLWSAAKPKVPVLTMVTTVTPSSQSMSNATARAPIRATDPGPSRGNPSRSPGHSVAKTRPIEPRTKVTAIHAPTLGVIVNTSATTRTRLRNPHNLGLRQFLPESPLTVEQVFHNYDPVGWP